MLWRVPQAGGACSHTLSFPSLAGKDPVLRIPGGKDRHRKGGMALFDFNQASNMLTQQAFLSAGEGLMKPGAGNRSGWGRFCCQAASRELGNNWWIVLSFLSHSVDEIQPVLVTQCADCVNPKSLLNCKKSFFR